MTKQIDPRAQELLADRALDGLTREEAEELRRLGLDDDATFDVAAAALQVGATPLETMPAHLAQRVLEQIDDVQPIRKRRSTAIAWIAAAACLALAIGAWLWAGRRDVEIVHVMPQTPSPAEARTELLASAHDAATLPWTATADPAAHGATGDVVWSPTAQKGYMRFRGLAPNDPTKTQYQLWIFDKTRDDKYPVDGGVFDVTSTGEVIVPISAKLHVTDATLFAVTVEQPGGVVVSKRERIVVTAAPHA